MTDEHGVTRHVFTADRPNQLWLNDITQHWTGEEKSYVAWSKTPTPRKRGPRNRIVGYSIDSRMKPHLAVAALANAAVTSPAALYISTGGLSFGRESTSTPCTVTTWSARWVGSAPAATNAAMESFFSLLQKNVLNRRSRATRQEPRIARSSPGSNGPTTAAAGRTPSAD